MEETMAIHGYHNPHFLDCNQSAGSRSPNLHSLHLTLRKEQALLSRREEYR